jgi:diguanylate cyclase (GGDEF)-like protein
MAGRRLVTSLRAVSHSPRTVGLWLLPSVLALAVWFAFLRDDHRLGSPWLLGGLLVLFLVFDRAQVTVEVRKQTHALSLSEIPLVVGLFLLPPLGLVLARVVAGGRLLLDRRLLAGKQVFNIGVFAAEVAVAQTVFRLFPDLDIHQPQSWFAALAAVLAANLTGTATVLFAIVVTSGAVDRRRLIGMTVPALVTGALNTTVGLLALVVMDVSLWGGALLGGLALLCVVGYRAYGRFLHQHENLNRVYDFSRSVERARSDPTVLGEALGQARDMFNASTAVLWARAVGTSDAVIVTAAANGELTTRASAGDETMDAIRSTVASSRKSRRFAVRDLTDGPIRAELLRRGVQEMIVAPLRAGERELGTLELSDRQGQLAEFGDDDLKLLETLATHLTAAIENQQLLSRLRHAAYHDGLTDLPNRARLGQVLEEAVATDESGVVGLVQLDLDRFKEVNDSLGHTWGDQLLVLVGRRLQAEAPAGALVARVGADEFAVVSRTADAAAAAALARTLREAVSRSYPLAGLTIDVAATAGVAVAPEHGDDGSTLMRRVDVALSNAKNVGRHVTVYDPSMEQESLQRLRLVTELRSALASGQVVVRYQPKVNLRSRELVGVEALVRWNHPEYGEVVPDRFVPLAEVTGLIGVLTEHVLRASLAQCRQWLDRDLRIPVAVNLSARTLLDADFPDRVAELLAEHEVPADMLSFELTESSVMTDPDRMKPVLHRLHELGTGLSIDDFGTGYSSLAQLRRLPVDEVKIDKVFVFSMGTDLGDLAIVRAIIELGHSLGLRVVAEGVEDELARDLLAGNDCDVVQGFLVSRALDPDRLDAWLSARTATRPGQPGVRGRRLQLLTA